jgi:hypothetical protein
VCALRRRGRGGVRRFWRRFWDVRLTGKWLLVSFLLWPLFIAVPALLDGFLTGDWAVLSWLSQPWVILDWFANNLTRSGGMSEDFGWWGYALPRLQARQSAHIISSIILGAIWSLWHLPLRFLAGSSQQGTSWGLLAGSLILSSILYTWLLNNGRGSILAAVVLHAVGHTVSQMFPGSTSSIFYWVALGLVVVLVVAIYGPGRLVRVSRDSPAQLEVQDDAAAA